LRRGCALGEGRSPFGAPLAAIFHLRTVASATRADFFGAPSAGISPRSPCHVQPTEGRPLVVGADGDPRRPGTRVRDTSRAPHQPFSVARSRPSEGLAGPSLRSQPRSAPPSGSPLEGAPQRAGCGHPMDIFLGRQGLFSGLFRGAAARRNHNPAAAREDERASLRIFGTSEVMWDNGIGQRGLS
jgi:hypothetical protein